MDYKWDMMDDDCDSEGFPLEHKEWVCRAKCPELDNNLEYHCECSNPETMFMEHDGCPVGNCPKWFNKDTGEPWKASDVQDAAEASARISESW